MLLFEKGGQGRRRIAIGQAQLGCQPLGGQVDVVDIVVDEMEEIAHLLVGRRLREMACLAELVVEACELLAIAPVCLVAGDQRVSEAGRVLGDQFQFLQIRRIGVEDRVGEGLGEGRQQPVGVTRGNRSDVDLEVFGERQEDGGRNRTLVVLDLVEVARRDADALGKGCLRCLRCMADFSHFPSDKEFASRHLRNFAIRIIHFCTSCLRTFSSIFACRYFT